MTPSRTAPQEQPLPLVDPTQSKMVAAILDAWRSFFKESSQIPAQPPSARPARQRGESGPRNSFKRYEIQATRDLLDHAMREATDGHWSMDEYLFHLAAKLSRLGCSTRDAIEYLRAER